MSSCEWHGRGCTMYPSTDAWVLSQAAPRCRAPRECRRRRHVASRRAEAWRLCPRTPPDHTVTARHRHVSNESSSDRHHMVIVVTSGGSFSMPVIVIGLPIFSPTEPDRAAIRSRSSGHQIAIRSQSDRNHVTRTCDAERGRAKYRASPRDDLRRAPPAGRRPGFGRLDRPLSRRFHRRFAAGRGVRLAHC